MEPIIKHFTDTDLYKLTMCYAILVNYPRAVVRYEFIDRNKTYYPDGFKEALEEQIRYLDTLQITDEEIDFLSNRCPYLPVWFLTYLRGYRFNHTCVYVQQHIDGSLEMRITGYWHETVLYEVMLLAIVSELYHKMNGHTVDLYNYYTKTVTKSLKLHEHDLTFSDFGTRRRFSFEVQDATVRALSAVNTNKGRFVGTSNVYLAMKYNLTPVGTMAHEWIAGIAGILGSPLEANYYAMDGWTKAFRGALGIYLYDTFTLSAFIPNFSELYANAFKGLRVDSGNNREQCNAIVLLYKSLGIDPRTKQVVFSNALTTDEAIALHNYAKNFVQDSYGIGTHFTCDTEYTPANIVIKLTDAKITETRNFFNHTCKMSEDKGKVTGNSDCINQFKKQLRLT